MGSGAKLLLVVVFCVQLTVSVALGASAEAPVKPVVPLATVPFPLQDMQLLGGPLKHSQDVAAEFLLSLDIDRMVAYYREEQIRACPPDEGRNHIHR